MWQKTAVNIGKNRGGADGWHYAQLWKTGGGPIGYCAEHEPHPTEVEARDCYARYQREHVLLDAHLGWTSCDAEGCTNPANKGARIPGSYSLAALCDEHLTMDDAYRALHVDGPAADSWGS